MPLHLSNATSVYNLQLLDVGASKDQNYKILRKIYFTLFIKHDLIHTTVILPPEIRCRYFIFPLACEQSAQFLANRPGGGEGIRLNSQ
jgi:hypothetical protein